MTTETTTLAGMQIGQIALTARDIPRAVAFYRDVLELRFLFEAPPGLAFFDCGGVRLMLGIPESGAFDHPSSVLYFRVADIQRAYDTVIARGAVAHRAPHLVAKLPDHDLWLAFFDDPEGNTLAFMSEVRRA
jgi:methylmalonyl-CoA/ethylmalonyl-CoA epimerase